MADLSTLIKALCDAGQHPARTVQTSMEDSGKPAVGLFPLFLPEELVYAAGFLPVGLWGGISQFQLADKYLQSFCCSIMRANMELAMKGSYRFLRGVLVPSQCDTLKCVCENMKVALPNVPTIGVTIPHNRTIPGAYEHLLREFTYIQHELERLDRSGTKPIPLEEAFAIYEQYRETMMDFVKTVPDYLDTIDAKRRHYIIKAAWFMDKAEYTIILKQLLTELKKKPKENFTGTRIVATGIMIDAEPVLDLLRELKVALVDDLLCHESLQFRTATRAEGDVRAKMAYRLLDLKGASPLYDPGKPRGRLLAELVKETKADAVLFCLTKFCDPDAFDQPLVNQDLEAAGIPVLNIEMDQQVESVGQLRTRIQAFLETASM